jgi:hypothetical protein
MVTRAAAGGEVFVADQLRHSDSSMLMMISLQ